MWLPFHCDGEGIHEPSHAGQRSDGDTIASVDSDVILDPKRGCAIIKAFESFDDMIGAMGSACPYWVDGKADWLPLELDWLIVYPWVKSNVLVEVRNCWGINTCFRREAFDIVGYFDLRATEKSRYLQADVNQLTGKGIEQGKMTENVEFSFRVKCLSGTKPFDLPDMKVLNEGYAYRLSTKSIIARSSWMGYSRRNIAKTEGSEQLATENLLLVSLFGALFQTNQYTHPGNTSRRTTAIILAAFALACGYFFGTLA